MLLWQNAPTGTVGETGLLLLLLLLLGPPGPPGEPLVILKVIGSCVTFRQLSITFNVRIKLLPVLGLGQEYAKVAVAAPCWKLPVKVAP